MHKEITNIIEESNIFIKKIYLFKDKLPEIAIFYRDETDNSHIKSIEGYFLASLVRRLDRVLEQFKGIESEVKNLKNCDEIVKLITPKRENKNG